MHDGNDLCEHHNGEFGDRGLFRVAVVANFDGLYPKGPLAGVGDLCVAEDCHYCSTISKYNYLSLLLGR